MKPEIRGRKSEICWEQKGGFLFVGRRRQTKRVSIADNNWNWREKIIRAKGPKGGGVVRDRDGRSWAWLSGKAEAAADFSGTNGTLFFSSGTRPLDDRQKLPACAEGCCLCICIANRHDGGNGFPLFDNDYGVLPTLACIFCQRSRGVSDFYLSHNWINSFPIRTWFLTLTPTAKITTLFLGRSSTS